MSLIEIRKRSLTIETILHDGGPPPAVPLKLASACAVIKNPYAGRYEPNLLPFMAELRALGTLLAQELVDTLGKDKIEVYSKAAIVGVNGELEHAAVWHEAGGWAMRALLGEPKAIVPAYVRSHFNNTEIGMQDAPRPDEILFALVMGTGGRIHERLGGLTKDKVSVGDGQR
jgi:hypothetical protein